MAILKAVWLLLSEVKPGVGKARQLTCGQIYMQLVRRQPSVPSIVRCVLAIDVLVNEGLLVSERVLEEDPAFPYTQHIIRGLTEIGAASLLTSDAVHSSRLPVRL
ncbi:hypothetical protein [Pseudomonas maioricensis]|uniref:hypothetical protein n=1 Tax=Pseudomonas maioricensis TaxID=1766623 RepID=UPI001FADE290|nr:hypothetical protein [Pseudomonas sp. S25]